MEDNTQDKLKLKIYSQDKDSGPEELSLTYLSKLLLEIFTSAINQKKNLIIVYPDNKLRPASLLSYQFMKNSNSDNKDVLFFTMGEGRRVEENYNYHLAKFCLIQEQDREGFIWHYYLPCLWESDRLIIKILFKKGIKVKDKTDFKEELEEKMKDNDENFARLIFSNDMLNAENLNKIQKIFFGEEAYKFNNKLGLCIFENLSNKIYNERELDNFINWISPLMGGKVSFVFHLSDYTHVGLIDRLKEKTNSLVFYISPNFLFSQKEYLNNSNSISKESIGYSLDSSEIYEKTQDRISIRKIRGDDLNIEKSQEIIGKIGSIPGFPPSFLSRIKKLVFLLPKLTVHPYAWGRAIAYQFKNNEFKTINIDTFFEEFNKIIKETDDLEKQKLLELKDKLFLLYKRLDETDRYLEDHPYKRKTKPYHILELMDEIYTENEHSEIIIGVYDGKEKNVLDKILRSYFDKNEVFSVFTLNQLNYQKEIPKSKILILPSYLVMRYFPEYFKPYKKIYVLAYTGEEASCVENQLNLLSSANSEYALKNTTYLKEIYDQLQLKGDRFLENIDKLNQKLNESVENKNNEDILERIKKKISGENSLKELKEEDELFEESRDERLYIEAEQNAKKDFCLNLLSVDDDEIKRIELSLGKIMMKINESKEIEETDVSNLQSGDLIVLIEGDERKSFVDYLAKKAGMEDDIDLYHIKIWKEKLIQYMLENRLNDDHIFEIYKKMGGNTETNRFKEWKEIGNIAPLKKEDLIIIGRIVGYDYLVTNIENLFEDITQLRTAHRLIGKEVNRLIKEKISGGQQQSSFEDFDLINQLKIYKINNILKNYPDSPEGLIENIKPENLRKWPKVEITSKKIKDNQKLILNLKKEYSTLKEEIPKFERLVGIFGFPTRIQLEEKKKRLEELKDKFEP